jgi:hypothetical protein
VRLMPNTIAGKGRQFILLAPSTSNVAAFRKVSVDSRQHRLLVAEAQRLRGKTYVDLDAINPSQLSSDGRHVHTADDQSWHLMTMDEAGHVVACLRYQAHPNNIPYSKLTIARSALAKSQEWGRNLRVAVEDELRQARERGCWYVEMGGWAITQALRCTTEALRMILTAYALAELSGGALGITNANLRSCSAAILRRIGGERLTSEGVELPSYFETEYKSIEVEILRFDSSNPNPRYKTWADESQIYARDMEVICRAPKRKMFSTSMMMAPTFAAQRLEEIA